VAEIHADHFIALNMSAAMPLSNSRERRSY
jgi:hypothetical protein